MIHHTALSHIEKSEGHDAATKYAAEHQAELVAEAQASKLALESFEDLRKRNPMAAAHFQQHHGAQIQHGRELKRSQQK